MDYQIYISTPKDTEESSPLITTVHLTPGLICGGFLFFPSGPAGNLHVVIKRKLTQILPVNQGSNYALDDCVVPLHFNLPIYDHPVLLDICTWNDSSTYDHALTVGIFLDPFVNPTTSKKSKTLFSRLFSKG